jgi:hypothetical protein
MFVYLYNRYVAEGAFESHPPNQTQNEKNVFPEGMVFQIIYQQCRGEDKLHI